jgi:hypothetical protein
MQHSIRNTTINKDLYIMSSVLIFLHDISTHYLASTSNSNQSYCNNASSEVVPTVRLLKYKLPDRASPTLKRNLSRELPVRGSVSLYLPTVH